MMFAEAASLRAAPVHSWDDFAPASFPLGRVWCVAMLPPDRMQWVHRPRYAGRHGYAHMECFNAERDVIEAGFETFVPLETRIKIVRGRKTAVRTPLFNSYIFVRFDREKDDWPALIDAGVVEDILRVMSIPVRIPDAFVATLRRAEQAGMFDYSTQKSPFNVDEDLEIMDGPFKSLIGKVQRARPREKVKLLLQAFASVEIDPCFLRKI